MSTTSTNAHARKLSWQDLDGRIAQEVFQAPKTGGDPSGNWMQVHERVVKYFLRSIVGTPWADHLALIAAVLTARRRDVNTVEHILRILQPHFALLFPALKLTSMSEWKPDLHFPLYMSGDLIPEHTPTNRHSLLKIYTGTTKQLNHWLMALPEAEQHIYQRFILTPLSPHVVDELNHRKELEQQQREHRKTETEAVVPYFADLRAEAHYRFNRLARLRHAYRQAVAQVRPDHSNLPLEFSYEDGVSSGERIHCKLWDRRTFVLDPKHGYCRYTRSNAKTGKGTFLPERNTLFLEIVNVERIEGEGPAEGFWFTELLTRGLLGSKSRYGTEQEVAEQQRWLQQWGYAEDDSQELVAPFETHLAGLLTWSDQAAGTGGFGNFISFAQERTKGALVPVEALYAASTFGLLALDLLTTTGLRSNELMQVSVLPECIVRLVDDPPPGASDRSPRIRYVLRLLPKGERTEMRHHYGVGKESIRLIEQTAQMLCAHYQLQPREPLPRVPFAPTHGRSHRFEQQTVPYIFQYNYQHLTAKAISACLRFLLHGMVFQTSTGEPVVIKPHLLRHAFATFAVQVEGLPIDLVAEWLKQKNLDTTRYYSQKGQQEVAEEHASFVERLATQINVREAILRSPEEIQKLAEQARLRVGTLITVCGGECTFDGWCHNQFDCVRCPSKAPDPEKRYQVEEKLRNAEERFAYYEREGLVLEAEKMRQLIRNCHLELHEMSQITAYRKDQTRVIQIEPRPKRPS
jgi:hypothetical protein